ncbi:hypothetical protein HanXRQr2_Chr07g0303751 [Helianthus annuus]|uniref:Uncharacterized protein n=1 Tax=Helianthus annuus TaxID=4232 RepID=A0A9K3IM66_HELAN|nr:hypothetical protein HanXRQr2_Chr07g0303751 [Helianthus annuus]KAJ0905438.1 hypothetical protein HanPSC8_Chr07g0294021 [Helianthus annuus]
MLYFSCGLPNLWFWFAPTSKFPTSFSKVSSSTALLVLSLPATSAGSLRLATVTFFVQMQQHSAWSS